VVEKLQAAATTAATSSSTSPPKPALGDPVSSTVAGLAAPVLRPAPITEAFCHSGQSASVTSPPRTRTVSATIPAGRRYSS
jgi:hypothetical protein